MIKRRKPIRQVSKRRSAALKEYSRRRKAYLERHPYCQVWLMENGYSKNDVDLGGGSCCDLRYAPRSTEIHHTKKPKQTYLNDETTWLAVSSDMHKKIEANKSWARERGYLMNY